jgi:hypothetical protein
MGTGFLGMAGINLGALTSNIAGVTMGGLYRSPASVTSVSFDGSSAYIKDCGTLVADSHPYHVQKNGGSVEITIQNEPSPVHMFLRPDGSLTGPGLVDVKGRIIIGYFVETKTHYGRDCPDGCSSSTRIPKYAAKIERCSIPTPLNPPSPAQQSAASNVASQLQGLPIVGALMSAAGTIAPASMPGIRMIGQYSSPGGLKLDFAGDAVILDCGMAHVKAPYTVENAPSNFLVHVQNNGGPFSLAVEPDNTLRGSGSTTVNGRLVSGMSGEDVTFAPHSETCSVGTLRPDGSASISTTLAAAPGAPPLASPAVTTRAAVPASPTSSSAPARVPLRVLIHSQFAGANPLAGQHVFVMREGLPEILRKLGVPVPDGATPAQAMKAFAQVCHTRDCKSIYTGMGPYFITYTTLDAGGNATLSATALTGSYFLFATVHSANGVLMWDLPMNLVAGDNKVALTADNGTLLH